MRDRFELILEAQPHELPPAIRLRAALKRLLRQFGLRCVALQPQQPAPTTQNLENPLQESTPPDSKNQEHEFVDTATTPNQDGQSQGVALP